MKIIRIQPPVTANRLHEELLAAFPTWRGTLRPDGSGIYEQPLLTVESDADGQLRLYVPDDADEGAIAAVIAAHDPSRLSLPQLRRLRRLQARAAFQQLQALRGMTPDQAEAWGRNFTTIAQARDKVGLLARALALIVRAGDIEDD